KVTRPTDAVLESHETYSTPMPYTWGDRREILIVGGDCVTGHDPGSGAELWRWGSWNPAKITHWRIVPSLAAMEGFIYVCAPKGSPVFAINAGGKGKLSDDAIAWKLEQNTSDVCVPLIYRDRIYVLDGDGRVLTCMDPRTGEVKWAEELEGTATIKASATGADGKIYIIDEEGTVFVLAAGDRFRILSKVEMGEGLCRSSIPVADGQLFIRTAENLYCVGDGE
ncbi:MAG: PQQ-binding-like beta-propeller repeat protein, partial [Candidatus Omnitrophica bacterium]|nr:PQQ-binding-like beta-propeller repeat protein [Candidatus Omnitrophota bacterium]